MSLRFHQWYAEEVSKQLKTVSVHEVRVDVSAAVIKAKSLVWFVSGWHSLSARPTLAINSFKKAGFSHRTHSSIVFLKTCKIVLVVTYWERNEYYNNVLF